MAGIPCLAWAISLFLCFRGGGANGAEQRRGIRPVGRWFPGTDVRRRPEYSGKMNFYLSAVDDMLRHPDDQPSIGLILCKSKKKLVVEDALRNTATPMGIAQFRHLEKLPEQLQGTLPTIEEIEAELGTSAEPSDPQPKP